MALSEIALDRQISGGDGSTKSEPTAVPKQTNAFSVDVEDYFQVEAFRPVVDRSRWDLLPRRVVSNTQRILDLLSAADVRGTFFVLGWVAERHPSLVRLIQANGHEIASHGFAHELAKNQSHREFRADVQRAKGILEDCTGNPVRGFRAPTFSITRSNWWTYEVLADEGYEYSSSIYPISHDLYGVPTAPRVPFRPIPQAEFVEIPLTTVCLLGRNQPCAGGGYFRLLPYAYSRWCLNRVNRVDRMACVFYCHPWEFDPDQPRFRKAPLKSQIRHYLNLAAMERRVSRLLRDFAWGRLDEVFLGTRGRENDAVPCSR